MDDAMEVKTLGNKKVIALVSLAHFYSHFFFFVLPPLFPLLKNDLSVSYVELGSLIVIFNLVSALTQLPMGIVVDRLDAPRLLICAVLVQGLALIGMGFAPSYPFLLAMMIPAGLANAIYHPADYSILNRSVDSKFMGRAFSIHTVSGFSGSALAPLTMVYLSKMIGWGSAILVIGISGVVISFIIFINLSKFKSSFENSDLKDSSDVDNLTLKQIGLLLTAMPILMGFTFWFFNSVSYVGVSYFSVSAFDQIQGMKISESNVALTAFLAFTSLGILIGGFLSDKTGRHALIAIVGNFSAGIAIMSLSFSVMQLNNIILLMSVAGFMSGLTAPSRDLLVRSVTPDSSIGTVFGFVSTGLNIGGIFAPIMYGWILDFNNPSSVFLISGLAQILIIFTVFGMKYSNKN